MSWAIPAPATHSSIIDFGSEKVSGPLVGNFDRLSAADELPIVRLAGMGISKQ